MTNIPKPADNNETPPPRWLPLELSWTISATILTALAFVAAYAEAGQFTNAIMASQQAIELAQASGNSGFARMNQQLQQLYRSGRAYHEKPRTPATNSPTIR